jgi:molecular chaperone GrpE
MDDQTVKSTKGVKLSKLQTELENAQTQYKRVLADYQNLERRSRDEKIEVIKFANRNLIEKFLPIIDHLELAAKHIDDKGLGMVITQFRNLLLEEGVEVIKTEGEVFDPSTMDCIEVVEGPKDTVTKTLLTGYQLNGTVIRHAKVNVGNGSVQNSN